ncbi:MAG: UDP-N-acetylmuramoyl-L-alanine--D-glutamate ligase, partial [Clostridiaceae bacterium]|nr:UDP-N-acetylmuramoyl-L-alanine--D-glutamate ligase [Clostridiaceae bacterium]
MTLVEFKKQVANKKVAVLGIGISNIPLIKMLYEFGAIITARDNKDKTKLLNELSQLKDCNIQYVFGASYLDDLNEEIIFKTPGINIDTPQLVAAKNRGAEITSEMEAFFSLCPADVIGVTGSDGKTTTTTLIYQLLKNAGYNCHLGGNIGKPLLSEITSISPQDKVILELSSFQLQPMKQSPKTAVITNVTPNHLDYHSSFEEYIKSKENIYIHQSKAGKLIVNSDNKITNSFIPKAKGEVITFGENTTSNITIIDNYICVNRVPVLNCSDVALVGKHNIENFMAAIGAVWGIVDTKTIQQVAKTFTGVEHRIEFVRQVNGVKYYNDSIATTPTRTKACFHSFDNKVIVIAGGYDKKLQFDTS